MKKALIVAVLVAVFGVTSQAHASVYLIDGKLVNGYVSGVQPMPSVESRDVTEMTYPQEVKQPLVGNTRIQDFLNMINPIDVPLFLDIVRRAGIKY